MEVKIETPFPEWAWPRVWLWMETFRSRVCDDFSPKTLKEFVERHLGRDGIQTWGVWRDEELGGLITFERWTPWLGTAHCMFRKDFWGRKTTEPALRQAIDAMFATGVGKLSFTVMADNQAIRALLKELGAKNEGVLRSQTVRDGKPVDMAMLGLLKGDWDATSVDHSWNRSVCSGVGNSQSIQKDKNDEFDDAAVGSGKQ